MMLSLLSGIFFWISVILQSAFGLSSMYY